MPIEVSMPRLSDTMENGTVIKWNVQKGDSVEPGQVLADIETDKATMELQAFEEGTVAKIVIGEGESVPVGATILLLAEEGEDVDEAAQSAGKGEKQAQKEEKKDEKKEEKKDEQKAEKEEDKEREQREPAEAQARKQEGGEDKQQRGGGTAVADREPTRTNGEASGRVFASPLARKIAEEKGLDLSQVDGSGPSGRIVRRDVEEALAHAGAPAAKKAPREKRAPEGAPERAPAAMLMEGAGLEAQTVSLSNMRRTIAKRLVESKTTIPHYQVTVSANLDPLMSLREQLNAQLESQGVKLTVNDFIVRACAMAMHQHPFVNSRWAESDGEASIEIQGEVNVGVAIALPEERGGGLVVATLPNTDRMGLRTISTETKRLAKKAREKGLTIDEMSGATFTLSNLGMFGVDHFTAIINPPNVCILAVGAGMEKPVVRDGQLMVGTEMSMTMSSDHRVVDGAMAAQYLNTVKQLLENPATLLV